MTTAERVVVFTLDEQRYGIPLAAVERVVRIVEITPLPAAPEYLRGVINVQGEIMPVINLRHRFGLPERPDELSDQLIIIRCRQRGFALVTESACEVHECTSPMVTEAAAILPDLPYLTGVVKLADGLILLSNPEVLLSQSETRVLDELLGGEKP